MKNCPSSSCSQPQRAPFSGARVLLGLFVIAALAVTPRVSATGATFDPVLKTTISSSAPPPFSAGVGDLNGDGKWDAIVSDGGTNLHLMIGHGDGTFTQTDLNVPNINPGLIRTADLNGDGRLDAVTVSNGPNWATTVLLNSGNNGAGVPQFTVTHFFANVPNNQIRGVAFGDLDGDGDLDVVTGSAYGFLRVFLNDGAGGLTLGQLTNITANPSASTGGFLIADMNGDGKLDVISANVQAQATVIHYGNGNGTLQSPVSIASPANAIAVADFNGDGAQDFIEVDGTNLLVFLNHGGGSFGSPALYPFSGGLSVTAADINGDGKLDAVASNTTTHQVAVFPGDGNGGFGAPTLFLANYSPRDVAVADFNGDSQPDIATLGYSDRTLGILQNTTPLPAPIQTLTLLGGAGNTGDVAANVEYYNPATNAWQPAYLAYFPGHGNHPWGVISGTDHWINYKADGTSDPSAGGPNQNINGTLWYLYRVRFTVPADATDAQMTFSLKADNLAQVAINGIAAGGSTVTVNGTPTNNVITGTTDQFNADAVFATAVHPGENTITINVGDFGGLNGFNFRIDLSMRSTEPLEVVEPETDNTPPVITPPANITAEATSAAGASVSFSASAVDAEDGPVTVVAIPASGSTFPLGNSIVDLGASDAAGNIATASFTVHVVDTTPPVISAPANLTLEAASAAGTVATFAATAHDIVAGSVSVVSVPVSGSTFPLGTSIVDLGAADNFNNMASASFTITVRDTLAPALTLPASQVLEATSAAGAVATFSATATDAVGVTSLNYSSASGSTFALGANTVTVTASDAAGNTSTGSFIVTVVDTTAPVITSVQPSTGVLWPPNHKMVPISVVVASSDNTGVADLKVISVTSNEPDNGLGDGDTANDTQITGPLSVNLRAERSGKGNGRIYTITVQATDAHGNVSTSTCAVSVPKSQGKGK